MAILILYRKIRETETEVEYAYGPSSNQQEGRLILDSTDPTAPAKSGADNPSGRQVAAKVLWLRQQEPTWTEGGAIQS